MTQFRSIMSLALLLWLVPLASCAAGAGASPSTSEASDPSLSAQPAGQSAPADAGPVPIEFGQLTPGTRYTLDTDPVLSVTPEEAWGAGPAAGGVQLIKGQTIVRIGTGFDEAYGRDGALMPVGADADAIFNQIRENNRIATGDTGEAEIAGLPARYLDADVIYEMNEEGGASILSVGDEPLFLKDLNLNRIFIIEEGASPIVIVVSGPETLGREEALSAADALLSTMRVEVD